jgi:hypothetical protein
VFRIIVSFRSYITFRYWSDPNTRIELLDKDNHVIGTGTTGANGHVIITPTQPIPEGNVPVKSVLTIGLPGGVVSVAFFG